MSYLLCWKCKRSITPLERLEQDKHTKKNWYISYCPFERCGANLDLRDAPKVKVWNGSFFEEYDVP